jgi:hypothetical protein
MAIAGPPRWRAGWEKITGCEKYLATILSPNAGASVRPFPNKVLQQGVNCFLLRFRWTVWVTENSAVHFIEENEIRCEGNLATISSCSVRNRSRGKGDRKGEWLCKSWGEELGELEAWAKH